MNDLISVIIPVYKVEPYLKRCVDSVKNQTYSNLEIILVDDGSPDQCPVICDELAKEDDRIIVIHKENGGLSDARNAGTDISTGSYIIYIDSDDYVDYDFIKLLYEQLKINNADISVSANLHNDDTQRKDFELDGTIIEGTGEEILTLMFSKFGWMAWGKLFKKEIIGQFRFTKGILYEDFDFIPTIFLKAKKVVYIKKGLYHYSIREDSIMGQTRNQLKIDFIQILEKNLNLFLSFKAINEESRADLIAWLFIQFFRNLTEQCEICNFKNNTLFLNTSKEFLKKNYKTFLKCPKLPMKYKLALTTMAISKKMFKMFFRKK